MNRTAIRNFATWARTTLIEQVRSRLHSFGISEKGIVPAQSVAGGIVVNGQTLNGEDAEHYHQLKSLIDHSGLTGAALIAKITEEIAYIWFNRLAALRFMEVNGYLSYRSLSSSDPNLVDPDILREVGAIAAAGDFEELDFAKLTVWRELAASQPNPDEWLYRKLLLLQCRDLSKAIACLFDRDKDYTLLFLPPNLLNSDSILKKLVSAIAEEDWLDIEIVGWLYQFYISEKKDAVIGAKSKVKAEDIPAATQLFTPHWIVRYMVENSLGRLWLEAHPESGLREKMPYYLDCPHPLAPSPTRGEGGQESLVPSSLTPLSLNGRGAGGEGLTPQSLTVCDPACGSGHILVYAFDLLFEIYQEQGYSDREIPALILEHNLFGLDIDDRAVQLASFAVLMKARARDKRFLRRVADLPRLNILWVRNTRQFFNERELAGAGQGAISDHQMSLGLGLAEQLPLGYVALRGSLVSFLTENAAISGELLAILRAFVDADHLGSLIGPPVFDADRIYGELDRLELSFPIYRDDFGVLRDVVRQAVFLRRQFRVVVANPPYMGSSSFDPKVKAFADKFHPDAKSDLFAMFMERALQLTESFGYMGTINQQSWMFLSSYEGLRKKVLNNYLIANMVHLGARAFPEIGGEVVQSTAFVLANQFPKGQTGVYVRLVDFKDSESKEQEFLSGNNRYLNVNQEDFGKIPSSAIAYWVSEPVIEAFCNMDELGQLTDVRSGLTSGDKSQYVRNWFEANESQIKFNASSREEAKQSNLRWFPFNAGGSARKWYGNRINIIDWLDDGINIKNQENSTIRNPNYYFRSGVTWTDISSSFFCSRFVDQGFIFENTSSMLFTSSINYSERVLSFLCSNVAYFLINLLNPTLHFGVGEVAKLPFIDLDKHNDVDQLAEKAISISRQDWDNFETSWDFKTHPLTRYKTDLIQQAFENWQQETESAFQQLKQLEEENNRYWIAAYGLQDELTPEVPDEQITIRRADLTRDIKSLLSYAVGCIMGRYALEREGLVDASDPHPLAPSPTRGEGGQENLVSPSLSPSSLTPLSLNGRGAGGEGLINPPHPLTPSPLVGEGEPENTLTPLSLNGRGAGGEGLINPPHPLTPSPTRGEGEPENTLTPPLPTWERGLGGEGESPIIPITSQAYFTDDIVDQIIEFLKTAYSPQHLQTNLDYIANALTLKTGENSRDRIRRYFLDEFVKDHIQTYKKRPIYWYFTSGKKKAFGALVYLHRYDTTTLARLRTDYVLELQRKLDNEIQREQQNLALLTTTAAKKASQKLIKDLQDQQLELREYQAKLQHAADKRIAIDLDDGVAYNYTLFEGLVYEGADLKMADLKKKSEWKRKNQ